MLGFVVLEREFLFEFLPAVGANIKVLIFAVSVVLMLAKLGFSGELFATLIAVE